MSVDISKINYSINENLKTIIDVENNINSHTGVAGAASNIS